MATQVALKWLRCKFHFACRTSLWPVRLTWESATLLRYTCALHSNLAFSKSASCHVKLSASHARLRGLLTSNSSHEVRIRLEVDLSKAPFFFSLCHTLQAEIWTLRRFLRVFEMRKPLRSACDQLPRRTERMTSVFLKALNFASRSMAFHLLSHKERLNS